MSKEELWHMAAEILSAIQQPGDYRMTDEDAEEALQRHLEHKPDDYRYHMMMHRARLEAAELDTDGFLQHVEPTPEYLRCKHWQDIHDSLTPRESTGWEEYLIPGLPDTVEGCRARMCAIPIWTAEYSLLAKQRQALTFQKMGR